MALKPRRIIEVGSGFSSLLMADVKARLGPQGPHITCIEPYPREFLRHPDLQIDQLIVEKVQNVKLDLFLSLKAGDILFIDSSHVIKTGSDVQYLYLEILPRIATGVLVHIHDIFSPPNTPSNGRLRKTAVGMSSICSRHCLPTPISFPSSLVAATPTTFYPNH